MSKPAPSPAETKMKSAIERLYFAANWHPDRVVDAAALWSAVRDAAGITPGQTASRVGPDRGCVTAPSPAKREHQFIEHHREAASEHGMGKLKKAEEKNKQLRHLLQLATGRTP